MRMPSEPRAVTAPWRVRSPSGTPPGSPAHASAPVLGSRDAWPSRRATSACPSTGREPATLPACPETSANGVGEVGCHEGTRRRAAPERSWRAFSRHASGRRAPVAQQRGRQASRRLRAAGDVRADRRGDEHRAHGMAPYSMTPSRTRTRWIPGSAVTVRSCLWQSAAGRRSREDRLAGTRPVDACGVQASGGGERPSAGACARGGVHAPGGLLARGAARWRGGLSHLPLQVEAPAGRTVELIHGHGLLQVWWWPRSVRDVSRADRGGISPPTARLRSRRRRAGCSGRRSTAGC